MDKCKNRLIYFTEQVCIPVELFFLRNDKFGILNRKDSLLTQEWFEIVSITEIEASSPHQELNYFILIIIKQKNQSFLTL